MTEPDRDWIIKCGLFLTFLLIGVAVEALVAPAHADYDGPVNPTLQQWFRSLMQPDRPEISCCGAADAVYGDYWVAHADGSLTVTVTDGRNYVPDGVIVEVPATKVKNNSGNPSGHAILFLSKEAHAVYCFVPGGGI